MAMRSDFDRMSAALIEKFMNSYIYREIYTFVRYCYMDRITVDSLKVVATESEGRRRNVRQESIIREVEKPAILTTDDR